MNGAAAHLITTGEQIIIMAFRTSDRKVIPNVAVLDKCNNLVAMLQERPNMTISV